MRRRLWLLAAALAAAACAPLAPVADERSARPAPAVPLEVGPWTRGGMVSAAHPHAVAAASAMLARGGHAVDAAIAAHAVLGLVEPESSGLGGSGFMLVYRRGDEVPVLYDGRETAPGGASADMFVVDGQPLGFREAWQTGISIGVPGTVAMYRAAHDDYGRLPWRDLFQPAIRLAREGFEVSPKLARWLERLQPLVSAERTPAAAAYLYPQGMPMPVGYRRDNPAYADTLSRIAIEGPAAFYTGDIAADIVAGARQEPLPGALSPADLATYEAVRRDAVCGRFRAGRICSAPPPSSGIAQIMIADLYDRLLALPSDGRSDADARLLAFVDAQRLVYADRDHYIADPDFVAVPVAALIDPAYLAQRSRERAAPSVTPAAGDLSGLAGVSDAELPRAAGSAGEAPGTSHLSIVDTDGNAVSLTASVGAPFGSLRFVRGFLLNNEMSDFSRSPAERDGGVANAVAPGKRPRSSMSPTMVFGGDGELFMVGGSPGGNSIVAYVAKSILAVMDWGLTAQQAADYPNVIARGESVRVESTDDVGRSIAETLSAAGYDVRESDGENSGLHLIVVRPGGLEGAADRRRDGAVESVALPR